VRAIATVWLFTAMGLWLVGAVSPWVPRGVLPDPALLAAVALGLHVPGLRGLIAAWGVGWQEDFLSGGPLGLFALLQLLAWTATRLGERQLALARAVALVPFTAVLTVAQIGLVAMLSVGPRLDDPSTVPVLILHAIANALAIPFTTRFFAAAVGRVESPDAGRGGLRFDAGAPLR
jgi:cell shape-determining protein MreD